MGPGVVISFGSAEAGLFDKALDVSFFLCKTKVFIIFVEIIFLSVPLYLSIEIP